MRWNGRQGGRIAVFLVIVSLAALAIVGVAALWLYPACKVDERR